MAEIQAIAHGMEHEENTIVDNAQKLMHHVEANAAGATDEAHRRRAQEEKGKLRTQSIAEQTGV
eukprot:6152652-Pyramimonas_sp.AAC.1